MSQPQPYNRSFSFSNYQAVNPSTPLPGGSLDMELNAVKATTDATLANLKLIQRDEPSRKNRVSSATGDFNYANVAFGDGGDDRTGHLRGL